MKFCVGLDFETYNYLSIKKVLDQTHNLVDYYKLNFAFFLDIDLSTLYRTVDLIHNYNKKIILDAKFNDIPNTMRKYAEFTFKKLEADAVTISPYMGIDSFKPFQEYLDKEIFIVLLSSNEDGFGLQKNTYEYILYSCNGFKNVGYVIGVVDIPEKVFIYLREDSKILIPGFGTQNTSLNPRLKGYKNSIYSFSRSVINSENPGESLTQLISSIQKKD